MQSIIISFNVNNDEMNEEKKGLVHFFLEEINKSSCLLKN